MGDSSIFCEFLAASSAFWMQVTIRPVNLKLTDCVEGDACVGGDTGSKTT